VQILVQLAIVQFSTLFYPISIIRPLPDMSINPLENGRPSTEHNSFYVAALFIARQFCYCFQGGSCSIKVRCLSGLSVSDGKSEKSCTEMLRCDSFANTTVSFDPEESGAGASTSIINDLQILKLSSYENGLK